MEQLSLLEGSVIAVALVVMGKALLDFLKPLIQKRQNGGKSDDQLAMEKLTEMCRDSRKTLRLTEDIHKWHDEGRDQDGRFLWYVPTSLEATMGKLADAVVDLAKVLAKMDHSEDK